MKGGDRRRRRWTGSLRTTNKTRNHKRENIDRGVEHGVTQLDSRGAHRGDGERDDNVSGIVGTGGGGEDEDGARARRFGRFIKWRQSEEEDEVKPMTRLRWRRSSDKGRCRAWRRRAR